MQVQNPLNSNSVAHCCNLDKMVIINLSTCPKVGMIARRATAKKSSTENSGSPVASNKWDIQICFNECTIFKQLSTKISIEYFERYTLLKLVNMIRINFIYPRPG